MDAVVQGKADKLYKWELHELDSNFPLDGVKPMMFIYETTS